MNRMMSLSLFGNYILDINILLNNFYNSDSYLIYKIKSEGNNLYIIYYFILFIGIVRLKLIK